MTLGFSVFAVDPKPIPSAVPGFEPAMGTATWPPTTSTLISDDDSALLVDCLITQQEGRDLAAWVRSRGPALKYVYITHPHADHLYGLPEILTEFPRAEPVALAESIPAMREQVSPAYVKIWNGFFPGQLTSTPVAPGPLKGTTITIGGSTATVIPVGSTDTGHSSVVHVPRLGLVVSGDVVYNRTHMWLQGSTPDSRASWVDALNTVAALDAGTLIAGHRHPQAGDDDARRQIDESRRYIADFENALESSRTPGRAHRSNDEDLFGAGESLYALGGRLRPARLGVDLATSSTAGVPRQEASRHAGVRERVLNVRPARSSSGRRCRCR